MLKKAKIGFTMAFRMPKMNATTSRVSLAGQRCPRSADP